MYNCNRRKIEAQFRLHRPAYLFVVVVVVVVVVFRIYDNQVFLKTRLVLRL